jgi:uncharacterized Zn finger protein
MPSIADLVEPPVLEQLAGKDEHEAGQALADGGAVRLVEFGPLRVVADVIDDGRTARVTLGSREDGSLDWACSCRGLAAGACRHVAAAAVETWRKSPTKKSGASARAE